MTVAVVKNAVPNPTYTMKCERCRSVFRYNGDDLIVPAQNPDFIACPCCGCCNWHSKRQDSSKGKEVKA